MLSIISITILSYLLGSIPFGIIISKFWKGIDIREYGSKNPGATNVYRVIGPIPALMVLLLDISKGLIATLLISRIIIDQPVLNHTSLMIIAGLVVILGHIFPVFASFKGGKGVATGLGVLISLAPAELIFALLLFLIIVAITRYVSLGSLSSALFILLALIFEKYYLHKPVPYELLIAVLVLNIFISYTHRSNIKRLLNGTENKFGKKQ
ncbi:MAG: glycerol-3-phosphate 1-O-acyltransferase PlsY [candidate division Zixibacteria bacterium]|nr:glycerol-3-phosphate 1-O-acyltransferase PlsY [candidate division Zixibacteria bacterium]